MMVCARLNGREGIARLCLCASPMTVPICGWLYAQTSTFRALTPCLTLFLSLTLLLPVRVDPRDGFDLPCEKCTTSATWKASHSTLLAERGCMSLASVSFFFFLLRSPLACLSPPSAQWTPLLHFFCPLWWCKPSPTTPPEAENYNNKSSNGPDPRLGWARLRTPLVQRLNGVVGREGRVQGQGEREKEGTGLYAEKNSLVQP